MPYRHRVSAWSRRAIALASLSTALVPPQLAGAQSVQAQAAPAQALVPRLGSAIVRGVVRDSTNTRLERAVVGSDARSVVTNDTGGFEIHDLAAGKNNFTVKRLGYYPVTFQLDLHGGAIKPVVVVMHSIPLQLTSVDVAGEPTPGVDGYRDDRFVATGFYQRKAKLAGTFLTPEDVARRHPDRLSDLMINVPGVQIYGKTRSRNMRFVSTSGQCKMAVYMDGVQVADMGDDFVVGSDIKAVEVYPSMMSASEKFLPSTQKGYCGSIVVWTK